MPKTIPSIPGIGPMTTKDNHGRPITLPISEAVEAHGFVFVAGQGGHLEADPKDPDAIFGEETRRSLETIGIRLKGLGLTFRDVVHAKVMLADWHDFEAARWAMNAVYSEYFLPEPPVRLLFGVAHLPGGSHVEIEVLAAR
jgi:2-iminobutanoate/2-iminopropanoate deaminase